MHPLSRALSRVGASERHHESKAVDTPQQCQTKAADTSQQWTSPSSWPSNDTPISSELQASDNGPNGERKLSVHKSARKVDDSVLDTRQSLGRGNEADSPQLQLPAQLGHDTIPVVSTDSQDELSAGVVDATTTVERSSTASNADGGATRSESTASELFSHQSSRPSTNNTSRSSANPPVSKQKTSSSQASSAASSKNSGALSAKSEAGAVSQIDSDLATASTFAVPAPIAVRSQSSGLSRVSYLTDAGSTKESLTTKLKLKLFRCKTDARYADSFGDSLSQVDGISQWQLSGVAKAKWVDILRPAIEMTIQSNGTAIYGNKLEEPRPSLKCTMIGKTAKQANPLIRITHRQKSVALSLAKLVEKLDPVKQSGFWVTHRQTQYFRTNWIISGLSMDSIQSKISLFPVCGVRFVVAANEKCSTIAAVVNADGRRYALTVSHVFEDVEIDRTKEEEVDDCPCSDADGSEALAFEYDEEEFQAWLGNEDSFALGDDQSPPASALFMASDLPLPSVMPGKEASKALMSCQLTTDTGPKWSSLDQQLDWALVELGEYEYQATNESLTPIRPSKSGGILTRVSLSPPIPNRDLVVVTRRGNLPAMGCESASTNEWAIQLKHGEFELGDSGSLIVDAEDDCVYGVLISGDPLFGNGYIAPAILIQDDLQRTLRADLQYGQEVRQLWPKRQFDVPILSEQYQMLPSKFKALLDAARAGDFRAISRISDSGATQPDQEMDQKKPLVEAAKRYMALTPIADVVHANSSIGKNKADKPIFQLARFYRQAAWNGFRGEEADLDAKLLSLRTLLARGADPEDSATIEGTALHQAAEDGNMEIVKVLVTHLDDTTFMNLKRHNCWSPLQLAAREGHKDVVEFLLANGADSAALNGCEDGRQDALLQIAASHGKSSVVRTLLDHNIVSTTSNGRFGGPLRAAVVSASRLYNEEMPGIEQNQQINILGTENLGDNGELYALMVVQAELFAIVKRYHRTASDASLVELKQRLETESVVLQSVTNFLTDYGFSGRNVAIPYTTTQCWGLTVFELLFANEASQTFVATNEDLEQAFFVAAQEGPSLLVEVLDNVLRRRLAPAVMREKRSKALCIASSASEISTIMVLLRNGVDVGFKDTDGWTALQLAADSGCLEIVLSLCNNGADLNRRGRGQQTAITCAAGSSKFIGGSVVEYLLERGADVKVKTKRRGNAVNLAAKSGNISAVKLLLDAGVNAETRTPRDGTPLEISANKGYTDIVQILLEHLNAKDPEEYLREALSSAAVHGRFATVKALLDGHNYIEIKEKLMAKVVGSNWVTSGVIDVLRKHLFSDDAGPRLRILLKAAKNQRHPTFPIPLHPNSEAESQPSSIAACLLQHEEDQSLNIPEELAIAIAERSDAATIFLLIKKCRNFQVTAKVLEAAASNTFHGDTVLSVLLKICPRLSPHQSTSILNGAVRNQELGVSILEVGLELMPCGVPDIDVSIFAEAAGNPSQGKELIQRLLLLVPPDSKLNVTTEIVHSAAENWSSGDLVIQALLESKSTTFTNETAIEIVLGFTGTMKDIGLDRYEVDVLELLLKREDFIITPEIRTIVMKRADRETVEMFENKVSTSTEAAGMDMEEQLVAAASNMDHAPEIVNYLVEKAKSITLTARLLDIATEREEENEPNIRGNLIMTALLKSNVIIHLEDFKNLLNTIVRDFDFATVEALLSLPELALKVTEFTLEVAVQNPQATPELLTMILEYHGESVSKRNTKIESSLEATSKVTAPLLTTLSEVDTVEFTTTSISEKGSKPMLQKSPDLREVRNRNSNSNGGIVVDKGPCHEVVPIDVRTASENSRLGSFAITFPDPAKPQQHVDSRVNEYVMISAVSNVEAGEDLVGVLLQYCAASIITEGVLRAAVRNRKQAWKIVELLIRHSEPDMSSNTNPLIEKFEVFEEAGMKANKNFWRSRITRRIFESAMRNRTETGNLVLLQLLKNDLEAVLTRDMFLEIIRQHKLDVVKELFANHGSTFPVTEDVAEEVFAAAAANWIAGVRVFRFITEGNKDLAAKIVPQSEKIAEALCRNWKSGKSVLDLLLRRFKLCVTERVLLACARNPYSGAEIMKILLRSYPGQVSIDVLRASAENFACGVPLLKLLLQRGDYTRVPAEVFQAACANGSCGHEILDFLADGNYSFTISEAALLACSRNGSSTRVFMVSPVTEGREVPMCQDLLQQQREKAKNGNQLLKPPLQYGGIVCLINMYASRWQECNIVWGLRNGVSEDETWVRREADWVWGTGRGILLDLLENHWIEGDSVPNSVLDAAARNFDSEIIHALLKRQDKAVSQSVLLSATTNELYAHEVLVALLSEKRLIPLDSITPAVLASAARNKACGRQLLEELWTEESEVTEDLWGAAIANPSQEKQLIAFLLEKGYKATKELVDDAVAKASQVSTIKLLLENFDDKTLVITEDTIRNAAGNAKMGSDLVEEILKIHPTIQVPDDALEAAAGNQRCGAKVMKLLLTRKPLSEVKKINEILVPAAKNPEQALRLLSMLVDADSAVQISPQVMKAAVENRSIAPQVVAFLVNRGTDAAIDVEVLLAAVANLDRAVQLLTLLCMQHVEFRNIDTLFNAAIMNWKSGLQILNWMIVKDPFYQPDIMTSMELAVQNVGCGVEILDHLLLKHQAPRVLPMSIWTGAAANLGCGNVLIDHLLGHCDHQVDLTDNSLLKAAAKNLNWSKQIFKAFSNILLLSDSPAKIQEEVLVCLVSNWKSGEDTIRFLKSSPRWSLVITDVLLQMIVQNTPDTDGALAVLLDGVEEFDFPELPNAVSPFWLVRSLKAIEVLVAKCKRSSIPQELVKKIAGGWRAEAVAKIIEGIEVTQEAFLASATNILNNGDITKLLCKGNPDLVVTEEMLQKAVGNNFDLTKTILDMGQAVSKTSLEAAVMQDHTRILSLFLEIMGKAKIGDSVLDAALDNGSPRMIQLLLQHGLEDPISEGQMCKAASNDANLEIMRMLLVHRREEGACKVDIPQSVVDEAIKQSSVLILKLLLEHNITKPFTENTWAKAVGQKNMEIVQMLIQHDPGFEVTDQILKSAVKSSRVEALKLLLAHEPRIKITQRMMERAAKCKTTEILKLLAGHIENAASFTITERFLKRAAGNKLEVVAFVFEQWPNIKITEAVFECVVENHDSKVLDLFYRKFSQIPFTTRHLVAAADHRSLERFRAVYQRAKEHSILPSEEVLTVLLAQPTPSLDSIKLVLDAKADCLTEATLQTAFRSDNVDIKAFKYIFQQRPWPPGLIQIEFRNLMRQRSPLLGKIKFLLEQDLYKLKVSLAILVYATENFSASVFKALLESPQTKDCAIGPDLLDTILKGTMRWSSNPYAENDRSTWLYTKLDTNVYQKVKLLLGYREVDVTLKNIVQAQSLKGVGRKIIQLFLDTPEKAKMTEEVKKYAASLVVVKELTFNIKPKAPSASVFAECKDTQEEHTHLPAPSQSVYLSDGSESVASYSSSSDGDFAESSSDSENRSRDNDHPVTYSLPFELLKSGVGAAGAGPAWTTHFEPRFVVHGV